MCSAMLEVALDVQQELITGQVPMAVYQDKLVQLELGESL